MEVVLTSLRSALGKTDRHALIRSTSWLSIISSLEISGQDSPKFDQCLDASGPHPRSYSTRIVAKDAHSDKFSTRGGVHTQGLDCFGLQRELRRGCSTQNGNGNGNGSGKEADQKLTDTEEKPPEPPQENEGTPSEQVETQQAGNVKSAYGNLAATDKKFIENLDMLALFAQGIKHGGISEEEVLEGLKTSSITRLDLELIRELGGMDLFLQREMVNVAFGGLCLSFGEFKESCESGTLTKNVLVLMVRRKWVGLKDIQWLVDKGKLSQDVATEVYAEHGMDPTDTKYGFIDVCEALKTATLRHKELEDFIVGGQFDFRDLDLLAEEGALTWHARDSIAKYVEESLKEAELKAGVIGVMIKEGHFSDGDLINMRRGGMLGASMLHYLVKERHMTREVAQQLLGAPMSEEIKVKCDSQIMYSDLPGKWEEEEEQPEEKPKKEEKEEDTAKPSEIHRGDLLAIWNALEDFYKRTPPNLPTEQQLLREEAEQALIIKKEKRKKEEQKQQVVRHKIVDPHGRAYGTGKRKCAIAQVWVKQGTGDIVVNRKPMDAYFKCMDTRAHVITPFLATDTLGKFDATVTVMGGGLSGQAQAVRHGLSRALQNFDPDLRPPLRKLGLLTRDSRIVERKKPGKAKARKSFTWVKR